MCVVRNICMRSYVVLGLLVFVCLALFACRDELVERNIAKLYNDTISLPLDTFIYVSNYRKGTEERIQSPYKMVVYVDSASCSKCSIRRLDEWDDLFYLERDNRVDFIYIFSTKDPLSLVNEYRKSAIKYGIYVDTCNAFLQINTHIPQENMYHTFMVDSTKHIILVGNPTRNKKIKHLFKKRIGNRKK